MEQPTLSQQVLVVAGLCALLKALFFLYDPFFPAFLADPGGTFSHTLERSFEAATVCTIAGLIAFFAPRTAAVLAFVLDAGLKLHHLAYRTLTGVWVGVPDGELIPLLLHSAFITLCALAIAYSSAHETKRSRLTHLGRNSFVFVLLSFAVTALTAALLGASAPSSFGAIAALACLRASRHAPPPVAGPAPVSAPS